MVKHVKNVNKKPTDIGGFNPDKESRISTGVIGGEMSYIWDDKEIISDSDGFGMLTGKTKIPSKVTSFIGLSKDRYDKIFKRG